MKHGEFLTGDRAKDQRNVELILGAVEELYGRGSVDDIVRSAVDRAIRVTGAQRGILLLGTQGGPLSVRLARNNAREDLEPTLKYSTSISKKVWTTGQPHLSVDTLLGATDFKKSITDLKLLSILAAPLSVKDRLIGVLYVDSTKLAKEFTDGDRAVFESLAGLVAVALEQARLAAEEAERKRLETEMAITQAQLAVEEAEKSRLEAEMEIAQRVQLSLMPKDLAPPPGFDLAAEGRSCVEMSGDYYDVIPLSDGSLALVVGDVSGHGLSAALFSISVRAVLRTVLRTAGDVVAALGDLNALLCRDMRSDEYMTLFVGILDPENATIRWVSAGHNWPIIVRASSPAGPVDELATTGPALGVLPGHRYRVSAPVRLDPGDTLVLYTDGLHEAHDAARDLYGEERFQASVRVHAARTPLAGPVLSGILEDLDRFLNGRPMDDDVTCMVLRKTGDARAKANTEGRA